MKNVFKSFAALAAILSFAACQKEVSPVEPAQNLYYVSFVAEEPATKTTVAQDTDEEGNKVAIYSWTASDASADRWTVYRGSDIAESVTPSLSNDGVMTITAGFKTTSTTGDKFVALFNKGINAVQNITSESVYDPTSDVMISAEVPYEGGKESYGFRFKRESAFALMTAKGLEGTTVTGVSINADKVLSADYNYENKAFEETGEKTIVINTNSLVNDGAAPVYFATVPVDEANLNVAVVTADENGDFKAAYEKSFTKAISFARGDVHSFGTTLTDNKVTSLTLDLSIDETTTATENELSWDRTFVKVVAAKAEATTPANNYYPGTSGKSYTATRFYKNSTLTFAQKLNVPIKKIEFTATSEGYASALANSIWANANSSASGTTVLVTPINAYASIAATIGATCGFENIVITYGEPEPATPHTVHILDAIENGTVSADPTSATIGTEITLTATPATGYEFGKWLVTNASSGDAIAVEDNKFTMPDADVNVSATFVLPSSEKEVTISLNNSLYGISTGNNGTEQSVTTDEGVTVISGCNSSASNKTYYDAAHIRYYADSYLKISVDGTISKIVFKASGTWNGSITVDTGTYTNDSKTWTGSAGEVDFSFAAQNRIASMSVTFVKDGTTKYTITCTPATGGTISANLAKAAEGEEVTLTATPDEGYEFNNDWTVEDASENPITVTEGKFKMPASNVTVSGSFTKKTYTIKRGTAEHGTFTINGTADDNQTAHKGDQISLAAEAESGYEHTGWTITKEQGGNVSAYNDNTTFTMPADNVTVTPVFTATASIPVYNSLADLVAAGKPSATETTVKVTLTNEVITAKNYSYICVKSGTQEVKLYKSGVPDTWEVGGTISGTLQCPWLLYGGNDWELKPNAWSELTYNAPLKPCSTPVISFTDGKASITSTEGATIKYAINTDENTQPELTSTYSGEFSVADGDVVWAQATKEGCLESEVAHQKYTAGSGGDPKTWTYEVVQTSPVLNANIPATVNGATFSIVMGDKVGTPSTDGTVNKYSNIYGWKWGNSKSAYWKSYTLSTDYFNNKKVKKVTVNILNNGSKAGTLTVKQGDITIGTATATFGATWTDLTADTTQGTGGPLTIQYAVDQASSIHSITVEYYE